MSKGPGLFTDIGKKSKGEQKRSVTISVIDSTSLSRSKKSKNSLLIFFFYLSLFLIDLLTKDYNSDQKLTISSYSISGVVSPSNKLYTFNHFFYSRYGSYSVVPQLSSNKLAF